MPVYLEIECKCGSRVLRETFATVGEAAVNLKHLYQDCDGDAQCATCSEIEHDKAMQDELNSTRRILM